MSNALVIVESPTKARTIGRFLGQETDVLACMGHVRDLPENSLGVDVGSGFVPLYVNTQNGRRMLPALRRAAAGASDIYLATDPDREGEAIAWHLQQILDGTTKARFHRVSFHEITQAAIRHAFESPGTLDTRKVDAQQARRILDRLVGYQISPLLWRNIQKGTSAGRVQSVALRLVCEREREILGFTPQEYWNLDAVFLPAQPPQAFTARLVMLDGEKAQVGSADAANALATDLQTAAFAAGKVTKTPRSQRPPPPFITSTLQQAAGAFLRMSTSQTMRLAQELYEGVDLGAEGSTGLITYMRTDSVAVAQEAQTAAREFITGQYGAEFVPPRPNVFRTQKGAQAAHEAIRPTDVRRTPESVAPYLGGQAMRVYRLIWNRFVASQMAPASILEHTIEVEATGPSLQHAYLFRATAQTVTFPGYQRVYQTEDIDADETPEEQRRLPEIADGTACALQELKREQKFTQPPKRFSEATLVRQLEQEGIGRPSTYSTIVNTIQDREYVTKDKGRLVPTPLGFTVNDYLVTNLPELFDVGFTARMESQLDEIEEGQTNWQEMLKGFYDSFRTWLREPPATSAPSADAIGRVLALFTDGLRWHPKTQRGRRTYDDQAFVASLKEQVAAGKPFSDKQWQAVLNLAARYADQIPDLAAVAAELGFDAALAATAARQKAQAESPAAATQPPDPAQADLLAALRGVKWDPPAKRGRRTYDDGRFFRSLNRQADQGRRLSPAQLQAAARLLTKYRDQVPGAAELTARLGLSSAEPAAPAPTPEAAPLLELLATITQWQPPSQAGRRTYDDAQFAASLRSQYDRQKALSPKQLAAIRRLLGRYHQQIPDYPRHAEALGLPQPGAGPARDGRPRGRGRFRRRGSAGDGDGGTGGADGGGQAPAEQAGE
jgi:DNA topoisomerase-1